MKLLAICAATLALLGSSVQAAPATFHSFLSGAAENPSNASTGSGEATVTFDLVTHMMRVVVSFEDLLAPTTVAHIHCCIAAPGNVGAATPTPTFPGFPAGVTQGDYDATFDMSLASSYRAGFLNVEGGGTAAGAEAALYAGLLAGRAYLNVHTSLFQGGEIRGFLHLVPEPATALLALFGLGLAGVSAARRGAGAVPAA